MVFKSQICTTFEQSKRLLELGLNPETADMCFFRSTDEDVENPYTRLVVDDYMINTLEDDDNIPAWSLHRLIELCPEYINIDGYADTSYWIKIYKHDNKIIYENDYDRWIYLGDSDNLFDTFIDCIEWLIKEGHFNKEYLKEG